MAEDRSPRASRTEAEERLLNALKARLRLDGRSISEIERAIGIGHGTLANVMRGRSELRFHHLELLGPLLGFTVPEIVTEAYGLTCERAELRRVITEAVSAELHAFWKDRGKP